MMSTFDDQQQRHRNILAQTTTDPALQTVQPKTILEFD